MIAQIATLTMMTLIPACVMGLVAAGASLKAPQSEFAYFMGLGVSLLGALMACMWFWKGGIHLFSLYSIPALTPVITGTFALGRAVR